eukprot:CAMPEP_0184487420 /NCGR_PEP_ID=MMETSP0113_2-20130426/10054_1 /TAXON_ID=91329 /ORGANISM="Norrisiella sphaerica, Strain BC52" /LENGTH=321 /DNA_ID=CAMNT_0026869731 /DNA_START=33 /DNA_END=998 /DNA_ORIENTATION=+
MANVTAFGRTFTFTGNTVNGKAAQKAVRAGVYIDEFKGEPLLFNEDRNCYSKIHHLKHRGKTYLEGGNPDLESCINACAVNKHCTMEIVGGRLLLLNDQVFVFAPVKLLHEGAEYKHNGKSHPLSAGENAAKASHCFLKEFKGQKFLFNSNMKVVSSIDADLLQYSGKTYKYTGNYNNKPQSLNAAKQAHCEIATVNGKEFLLNNQASVYSGIFQMTFEGKHWGIGNTIDRKDADKAKNGSTIKCVTIAGRPYLANYDRLILSPIKVTSFKGKFYKRNDNHTCSGEQARAAVGQGVFIGTNADGKSYLFNEKLACATEISG